MRCLQGVVLFQDPWRRRLPGSTISSARAMYCCVCARQCSHPVNDRDSLVAGKEATALSILGWFYWKLSQRDSPTGDRLTIPRAQIARGRPFRRCSRIVHTGMVYVKRAKVDATLRPIEESSIGLECVRHERKNLTLRTCRPLGKLREEPSIVKRSRISGPAKGHSCCNDLKC